MPEEMIGFCGIICSECPAFIATKNDDGGLRRQTALKWSSDEYPIMAEDVICYGCHTTNKKMMAFCLECKVRDCGLKKALKNCAYCDEYPCEKLEQLWKHLQLPEAKQILDKIREQRK